MRLYEANGDYKYSLFGALFDQGGSASDLYNQPDRLHMELLGLSSWNELEDRVVRGEADASIQSLRASDPHFDEADWTRHDRWRFVPRYMADEYARRYKPHEVPTGGGTYAEQGPLLVRPR